jgi:hypothetical protein
MLTSIFRQIPGDYYGEALLQIRKSERKLVYRATYEPMYYGVETLKIPFIWTFSVFLVLKYIFKLFYAEGTDLFESSQEAVEDSDDAHVVVIQKILDFVGDYDEKDMFLLVLEDFFSSCL